MSRMTTGGGCFFFVFFFLKTFSSFVCLIKGRWQTVQTQIRCCRMQHLNRITTVCKKFNHFSSGISKSHTLTYMYMYLKLKLESSDILCGGVHSVCSELRFRPHRDSATDEQLQQIVVSQQIY